MLKFNGRSVNELSSSMGLNVVMIENAIFQKTENIDRRKVDMYTRENVKDKSFLSAQCHEN
jgi:hypothetical protein